MDQRAPALALLGLLLLASAPTGVALDCAQPPGEVWASLVEIGGDVETTFLARGPGGGTGCSTASDNNIGERWYVWKESLAPYEDQKVKVLERGTSRVRSVDYPSYEGQIDLSPGGVRGDILVHPITDHREGHLTTRFYQVDLASGQAARSGLEIPREVPYAITGSKVVYVTEPSRLNIFDVGTGRHLLRDQPLGPHDRGKPTHVLAADDDRLVVVTAESRWASGVEPWLYDHQGEPVRALDEMDPHEGITCARFDDRHLYYAYHEDASLPWFPQPARIVLGSGVVETLGRTSHGIVQPCAPVHDGTMAVFSVDRPTGPFTQLYEVDGDGDGSVEIPAAFPVLVVVAALLVLARRRPR